MPEAVLSIVAGSQEPIMPIGEVVAKLGATVPEHTSGIATNEGLILGAVTFTFNVCVVAHCPAFGVNTYDPEFALSIEAGNQEPIMPIGEVVAKLGATVPEQTSGIATNEGLILGAVTFTFNVCVVAHCPASGVNSYVPEAVLSIVGGVHKPVIPFGAIVSKLGTVVPAQMDGIGVKSGKIGFEIVTTTVVGIAQGKVPSGVKM